jgi:hypothetical protein
MSEKNSEKQHMGNQIQVLREFQANKNHVKSLKGIPISSYTAV